MTDKPTDKPVEEPIAVPDPAPDKSGQSKGDQPDRSNASREVQERIKRAKRIERETILKELGYEDLDTAKAALTEVRAVKEGQMSELQKAQAALDTEKKRADKAVQDAADLKTAQLEKERHGALKDAAREAKAEKPEHVLMWAKEYAAADLLTLVDEDGKVDAKAVEALIKRVQAAEPKWFGTGGPGSPSNRGGNTPQGKPKEIGRTFKL